jgi:tetratricopeptide (TPR) repeat protein
MQNRRRSFRILAILATFFFSQSGDALADKFPEYLATQYQPYFARYVDNRTLSEQMLNAVRLTSKDYGRGFALIAGVSKYPNMTDAKDLVPASEDVRKLVNYLVTYEKFDEVVVLKDADVTDANLIYFLQRYFPRRLQEFPRSRFLFAYSGHGATVNNRGYLLTSEARNLSDAYNGIPMNTVRAMFQQVVDSGFHVLALINACYSGDFLRRSFGGERRFIPKYGGAHAITAGGTGELTWHDGSIGTGSVFFEKFFAALDGRAGRDGVVTVDELSAYLRREVQISTDQQQNPLPGDLSRDGSLGGFFFFNRRPLIEAKVLPDWDSAKGLPFGAKEPDRPLPPENDAQKKTRVAALLSEAYTRHKNGDYDQSILDYNEVIGLDSANIYALLNRGAAYQSKGDATRSIADLSEVIRLDPKFALAFGYRGNAYAEKREYDRAIADFTEATRLDPAYAFGFTGRGAVYIHKGNYERAIADLNEAIRLDPTYVFAYFSRGNAFSLMSRPDPAIADFTEVIRLDPKNAKAFHGRGSGYFLKGNYDAAIADLNEAIRLDPNNDFNFYGRGTAYFKKNDFDRAIADHTSGIRINPNSAINYYWRGIAKRTKGDGTGGTEDIAIAKQIDPSIETRAGTGSPLLWQSDFPGTKR